MKYIEFANKFSQSGTLPFYILSGDEYFLKKQALSLIKKRYFLEGGSKQGLIEFNCKETGGNLATTQMEHNSEKTIKASSLFNDIIDEANTAPMFGKHKLIIVENADSFLGKYQEKILGYIKNPFDVNSLIFSVLSIDKRTRLAKAMDGRQGMLLECHKLYDRPAPWETMKPEHESELTKWIVTHARNYDKTINLKSAFCLLEKTGNNLAIIDKQLDALSVFIGKRDEITREDIQTLLGSSHREKLYDLLDAVGMKDTLSAIKIAQNIFSIGMENERKAVTFDAKSISITIVISLHKRMKVLWKIVKLLDEGGGKKDIMEKAPVKKPFVDKMIKQARNFNEEEMPEKWKYMLDADLLCKTSRLTPTLIIEQLIIRLCN